MSKRFETSHGPTQRQLRVGELLRRALAQILLRGDVYIAEMNHVSVTVGEVRMSPDLKLAHVYVLPLGGAQADMLIKALNDVAGEFRRVLNKDVTLKFSPKLKFVLDRTFDQLDETRRLLNQDQVKQDVGT